MPLKDREAYRAYMKAWYHRPENQQRTVAKVAKRKKEEYFGLCVNCGAKTAGQSKAKPGAAWCAKCRKEMWQVGAVPAFLLQETLRLAQENIMLDDARHVAVTALREAEDRIAELEAAKES